MKTQMGPCGRLTGSLKRLNTVGSRAILPMQQELDPDQIDELACTIETNRLAMSLITKRTIVLFS